MIVESSCIKRLTIFVKKNRVIVEERELEIFFSLHKRDDQSFLNTL